MNFSATDDLSRSANRKLRKLLARAYLRESRISEALEVYQGILKDYPGDVDVWMVLGNLYRLSGSPAVAERLFRMALVANPEDPLAAKQVLAAQAQTSNEWEASDPLSEEAVISLADHLQAKTASEQKGLSNLIEEIRSSADMPERSTSEDRAGEANENGHQQAPLTGQVQQLMPALIAQNIRRARAAGFIELAESLQSLQIHLARQVEDRWADDLLKDEPPPNPGEDEP